MKVTKKLINLFQILSVLMMLTFVYADAVLAYDGGFSAWAEFLANYESHSKVNYSSVKNNPDLLKKALANIESLSREEYDNMNREEKLAFWFNAYNAGAIKLVVDNYPLKRAFGISGLRYPANSIQQIPEVWDQSVLTIFGELVSLNHIEHDVLRVEFKEPRIHFAVVCASIGCPPLRAEPFLAENLDGQLNDQFKKFLSDQTKNSYSENQDVLYLSPIFKWFSDDFDSVGGVKNFVKPYIEGGSKIGQDTEIQWTQYDWELNEYQ